MDFVGFGEPMVQFQPPPGRLLESAPTVNLHVAGAEFNVCASAARLGAHAALCSRVGADPLGARVVAEARRLGIDPSLLVSDVDHPTGAYLKDVLPDGERRVYYYRRGSAASTMDSTDAHRALAARPAVVVVSGITLALGPAPRQAVGVLVREARARGIRVALDPNFRPALGPVDEQAAAVREILSFVDVLILGTDEAGPLFDTDEVGTTFAAAAAAGVAETVLKAGPEGCYHADGERVAHLPSAATTVVDPVGAGDAFAGGYLVARLRGATPARAAHLGNQLAAAVVAAPGDTEGLPDAETAASLLSAAVA